MWNDSKCQKKTEFFLTQTQSKTGKCEDNLILRVIKMALNSMDNEELWKGVTKRLFPRLFCWDFTDNFPGSFFLYYFGLFFYFSFSLFWNENAQKKWKEWFSQTIKLKFSFVFISFHNLFFVELVHLIFLFYFGDIKSNLISNISRALTEQHYRQTLHISSVNLWNMKIFVGKLSDNLNPF